MTKSHFSIETSCNASYAVRRTVRGCVFHWLCFISFFKRLSIESTLFSNHNSVLPLFKNRRFFFCTLWKTWKIRNYSINSRKMGWYLVLEQHPYFAKCSMSSWARKPQSATELKIWKHNIRMKNIVIICHYFFEGWTVNIADSFWFKIRDFSAQRPFIFTHFADLTMMTKHYMFNCACLKYIGKVEHYHVSKPIMIFRTCD